MKPPLPPPSRFWLLLAFCLFFSLPPVAAASGASNSSNSSTPSTPTSNQRPSGPADGPGVWMNIWNYPDSSSVDQYCKLLASHGVRNCFVQTSRSNTEAIAHPPELSLLIDACHLQGIRVIAWSFTELANPAADAQRLLAAAKFRTTAGGCLDAIASDMESNLTAGNVDTLGQALRAELGPSYPLVAIAYSPLNHAPDAARTPWKLLTKYFDVIAPMTYWSGKKQTLDAYTYTCMTIKQVRQLIGKSDVEIQPIGDAMYSKPRDILLFMKACRENEATGASLYPNQKLTPTQLSCLDKYSSYFAPNSRFRLAAYRQMRTAGIIPEPPGGDPCCAMSRGRFYQLLVTQAGTQNKSVGASGLPLTEVDSYNYLQAVGIAPRAKSSVERQQYLEAPISTSESLNTIAALMNLKAPKTVAASAADGTAPAPKAPKRHKDWLMQAAKAAEVDAAVPASTAIAQHQEQVSYLNYIDAAQLAAQARAGLR